MKRNFTGCCLQSNAKAVRPCLCEFNPVDLVKQIDAIRRNTELDDEIALLCLVACPHIPCSLAIHTPLELASDGAALPWRHPQVLLNVPLCRGRKAFGLMNNSLHR